MAPLRVLFVASEVAPFRKTGGLADVAGSLPKALARRGVDVRVVMPLYRGVRWEELERLDGSVSVPMFFGTAQAGVRLARLPNSDVPVYFLEHHHYFDRPHVYGPPEQAYADNLERFSFLSRGALELCKALGFSPDVIHAHDWQTALVPVYVNTVEWSKPMHAAATVFTIHNLAYQGNFNRGALPVTGLGWEHDHPGEFEHFGDMNLMKAAIRHSTLLSTVSPTYAREVRTPDFGFGLDGELTARGGDLRGILNGIDAEEWDPTRDPLIPANFSAESLSGKAVCKAALQEEFGLPIRADVPVVGVVGRLTHQKGFDVLARAMDRLLSWDLQIVLLGTGDPAAERFFRELRARRPNAFGAHIGFEERVSHLVEAGCDFLVMPSRFEPCGLNQLYGLRYGTLPIVHGTGGLVDTVHNYDEASAGGTGFVFGDLTVESIENTIGWALSTWYDRTAHIDVMRRRAMGRDYSWERAAAEYERLYLDAYERRRKHPFHA